jgi:hypothetical protein
VIGEAAVIWTTGIESGSSVSLAVLDEYREFEGVKWGLIMLTEQQRQRALVALREYLDAAQVLDEDRELDRNRATLIESDLKPLVQSYLDAGTDLATFKSKIDGLNKRNPFWGFKGIKGQMFFNMVVNVADDLQGCDQEIKSAIALPTNEQIASSRMKTFASYVQRLGDQWVGAGNTRHGCPKLGSIPFFLSYFWQVQDRDTWPVYYTSSVNAMVDLNLWQLTGDPADDYMTYKRLHEGLGRLFAADAGRDFHLYDVEHVFWFKGGNPYKAVQPEETPAVVEQRRPQASAVAADDSTRLPESYVPPIVAILPRIARHEPGLEELARRSGTNIDRAFEKYVDAAFTILGYDTKLLGQGQGRVPDGVAVAVDESYAILWDGKIRSGGYSMGTDDRTIREYITTQSRELKRRRGLRNIYYAVVSSEFADDFDDPIRSIKMETDVNEVILVEADALVVIVDAKLRSPLQVTLGPDGLQRLFSSSGILRAADVIEQLV